MPSAREQWAHDNCASSLPTSWGGRPAWAGLPGASSFGGYGPDGGRSWDARPSPPSGAAPRGRNSIRGMGGMGSGAYRAADDPRANPHSKYYEPECDPNSRFYAGPQPVGPSLPPPPSSGSGVFGAYGVAPPRPPRSAPGPQPATCALSPNRKSGGRHGKRGNARPLQRAPAGSAVAPGRLRYTSSEMAAAQALSGGGGSTDMGSLYYVLGTQGSSRRVKQLHQMLVQQGSQQPSAIPDGLPPAKGSRHESGERHESGAMSAR